MSEIRDRLRELVLADIRRQRPDDTNMAELIVDRLLSLPAMQDEANMMIFIDSYQRAVVKREAHGT